MQRTTPVVRTCLALLAALLWLADGCASNPNPLPPSPNTTQTPSTQGTATTCTGACTPYILFAPWSVGPKPGASVTFSATAYNVSDPAVTWTVQEGTTGGTITDAGVYTAPLVEGVSATLSPDYYPAGLYVFPPGASGSITPSRIVQTPRWFNNGDVLWEYSGGGIALVQ